MFRQLLPHPFEVEPMPIAQQAAKCLTHLKHGHRHPVDHHRMAAFFADDTDEQLVMAHELKRLNDDDWMAFLTGFVEAA